MGTHSLPSPPAEDSKSAPSRKSVSGLAKQAKPANRISKRANSTASAVNPHNHVAQGVSLDGRHKRVWKACERCRMKKTKCDGEFPCKRCKDDGVVCTAGVRKKVEYKQLPKGYAEVLENTQFALIATVHKLYSMLRSAQAWDLGEPEVNDRGQPVIHNIAQKLGCIRPNSDIDLPVHSVFPENEAGMAELARQLDEQQQHQNQQHQQQSLQHAHHPSSDDSPERDHSDNELDYQPLAPQDFGQAAAAAAYRAAMSPPGFARPGGGGPRGSASTSASTSSTRASTDFAFSPTTTAPPDLFSSAATSPHMATGGGGFTPAWAVPKTDPDQLTMQLLQQSGLSSIGMLNQALLESDFGTIKPDILSRPNPDVMMGMGDPMMCSAFEGEALRL